MGTLNKIIFDTITMIKIKYMKMVSGQIIDLYFRNNDVTKINIGCGINFLDGWLNCDILPQPGLCYVDCTRKMPFPDESVNYVFSEHMIEHIELHQIETFLVECYRVLKRGGTIRLATPDLDFFTSIIEQPQTDKAKHYMEYFNKKKNDSFPLDAVRAMNSIFYEHGHRYIMNGSSLSQLMSNAGFVNIRCQEVGKSGIEILRGIEKHGERIGNEINKMESLALEADKI